LNRIIDIINLNKFYASRNEGKLNINFFSKNFLYINVILSLSFALNAIAYGGFAAGMLVKVPDGYMKIEDLNEYDSLVCYDLKNNKQKNCIILGIRKTVTNNPVVIELSNQKIITAPTQKFYFADIKKWLDVFAIKNHKFLCSEASIDRIYESSSVVELYEISVAECHNFYITTNDILVHNFALPIIVACVGVNSSAILSSVIAGALGILGISFLKRKKINNDYVDSQNQNSYQPGSPDQNDPEDSEEVGFFERIRKGADKKARTKRFGNLYRDPKTKLWWSKDRANHGGSAYKVFKEQAKGLEWLFDADVRGNPIIGKHKGPTGIILPYKDLILCQ